MNQFSKKHVSKFIDLQIYQEIHLDLLVKYDETDEYKESLFFLETNFPDWKKHKGLGYIGPLFLSENLKNHIKEDGIDVLLNNINRSYKTALKLYKEDFEDLLITLFNSEYSELIASKTDLPQKDFKAFCDMLLLDFRNELLEIEIFSYENYKLE